MHVTKLALFCLAFIFSFSANSASQRATIEDLSAQVAPLWADIQQTCLLAMQPQMQQRVSERLQFAKQNFTASRVADGILANLNNVPAAPWQAATWATRERLEKEALQADQRDNLREYYFKLQTQTPTETRLELVNMIVEPVLQMNLSLHEGLWKSCYSLNIAGLEPDQLKVSLQQRWQQQQSVVRETLHNELSAFYFFAFRQVDNTQLNRLAKDASAMTAWTQVAADAIDNYFSSMQVSLSKIELSDPIMPQVDEPFLEVPLGNPAPSPGLLAP